MTGLTTRSMPVMVVENRAFGNRAYCTVNEGLGKVMRFGGNDASVLDRLRWLASTSAPCSARRYARAKGWPLEALVARGLSMGDEMHQRNVACTSLLLRALARRWRAPPGTMRCSARCSSSSAAPTSSSQRRDGDGKGDHGPVRGIDGASIVTAMSRNGTDFGVRLAGTGDRWFTAPVEIRKGSTSRGSPRTTPIPTWETPPSWRRSASAGSRWPRRRRWRASWGRGAGAALDATRSMYEITAARNPKWTIPALDFAGVPAGIDARKVLTSGLAPTINTGIAHREPGVDRWAPGS